MKPLYAISAAASALYGMVIVAWIVSEASVFFRHVRVEGDRRQDRLSGPALVGFLLLAVWLGSILASTLPGAAMNGSRPAIFGLGFVLAIAGIGIRQYAIATLGRWFSMRVETRPDQTVVDTGLYRYVRHPSYSGSLLTVVGMLLCSTNWLSLACFVLALPGFIYRIRVEELALTESLGEPYREYMRRTKRLVPFLV